MDQEQATHPTTQESTVVATTETLEELRARHKKEQRDLTAKVTALKKTATKGDKKKKKEVLAEVAQLEHSLNQQQDVEEKAWLAEHENSTTGPNNNTDTQPAEDEEEDEFDVNDIPIDHLTIDPTPAKKQPQQQQQSGGGRKPNRQKARKDRKAQALRELQDDAEKEAAGQVNMNEVERKAIEELASVMNVTVKDVTADGHCLYNAIADQLSQHYQTETSAKALRQGTAEYMRTHSDDFLPFLTNKQGDMMSPEDFSEYCNDLESTAVWGGQPELLALSRVHKVPIWVVQMGSPTVKLSADVFSAKTPLMVSYHRHMYGLGEHYNSLRPKQV
ncbi:OTU domain-containing protein 6B [Mortierella sp. GBA35]|nr:OTU domain-containing protein 6B [Mortierella sp. AD031]KAF9096398.1 OTU domain-containing protein 6B [Mortierella sp. GBA35]KAG0201267.1 OTU domain-containing protein 6B [Mortierella sp. NVP41]